MVMRNVVRRVILADVDTVGAELDRIERHWPAPPWPVLHLDRGLTAGSPGRHGPIRYHVESYQPGRRTRWVFTPDVGLTGYNEISVIEGGPEWTVITDELAGRLRGRMVLVWPLGLRWLHEALINDLFDNLERAATGRVRHPSRHTVWVRTMRWWGKTLDDSHSIRRAPDTPTDPEVWADAIFRDPPLWVAALLGLRNLAVRAVGVPPATRHAFDTISVEGNTLVLGQDDQHLDFRASIVVDDATVTVGTTATTKNRRGRLYLAVVRLAHPFVVRSMLAHAQRSLRSVNAASASRRADLGRAPTSPPTGSPSRNTSNVGKDSTP
jgi:hypothetical protein